MALLRFLVYKSRMYKGKVPEQLTKALKDCWPRVLMQFMYWCLSHSIIFFNEAGYAFLIANLV